jgi:uncharacterized protein YndB with AHSA1/START domain
MTEALQQLEVSRVINASPDRLFEAWTTPDMIVRWWGAGGITCPEAEMDLAVGGRYRIANETPDGNVMWISGIFSKVDPPHELAYSWGMEPIDDTVPLSLVEVIFSPGADGTLVTVRQTQIATPQAREMHLAGWVGCLEGLESLLAN